MKLPKYEVFLSKGGKWSWRLRAANGEIQHYSQGYASKGNAKRGAQTARANSRFALIVIVRS